MPSSRPALPLGGSFAPKVRRYHIRTGTPRGAHRQSYNAKKKRLSAATQVFLLVLLRILQGDQESDQSDQWMTKWLVTFFACVLLDFVV